MSKQVLESLYNHQSIRNYHDQSLTKEQIESIEKAVIQVSSSCFFQMVTTIRVNDRDKLRQIGALSGDQNCIATCAEFWVFCIDATKLIHMNELKTPIPFRLFYSGLNDVSLCCQQALVAAESMNLGCVIVGGHKQGIRKLTELLNIPKGVIPALCLCIGVPDEKYREAQKPRLPKHWLFMENEFKDPFNEGELKDYNEKMRQYYLNRNHGARDDTWNNSCRELLNNPNASQVKTPLIEYIEEQGFSLSF